MTSKIARPTDTDSLVRGKQERKEGNRGVGDISPARKCKYEDEPKSERTKHWLTREGKSLC